MQSRTWCPSLQQVTGSLCLQILTVWREYAAVIAYKHAEMSQQVTEAQQQLNQGICLLLHLFIVCVFLSYVFVCIPRLFCELAESHKTFEGDFHETV